jgi:HD-GYP domain-containing protein (c-di-GMP phosphodiesterase class II)
MRRIRISDLKVGQKLGKTIYDDIGRVLLRKDTILSATFIEKLAHLGLTSLFIEDAFSEGIYPEEMVSETLSIEIQNEYRDMVKKFIIKGRMDYGGLLKSVSNVLDEVLENKNVMMSVSDIRSKDEFLFAHSMSVCVLATHMAMKMGYTQSRVRDISVGAMLHDVGKLKLIKDRNLKMEQFNTLEKEVKKTHTRQGYDLLGEMIEIGPVSKVMALLHHENCDGSGYPMGFTKDKIHESARLLAICNDFDNMVTGNSSFGEMPVHKAVEYLLHSVDKYDQDMVKVFVENLSYYPNGTPIETNDGRIGMVMKQNKGNPLKPVIRVIMENAKTVVDTPYVLDLMDEQNTFIFRTVPI